MKQSIVVTDLTRMNRMNICIAGYTGDYRCIRPVFPNHPLNESWLWDKITPVIRPFSVIEFDLDENKPEPPHTEDWLIKSRHREHKRIVSPQGQREILLKTCFENVADIFGAPIKGKHYVKAGEGQRSLGTVQPEFLWKLEHNEKWGNYRLSFKDQAGKWYSLPVNDLTVRDYLRHSCIELKKAPDEAAKELTAIWRKCQVFIRVGLARRFPEHPDRCHLQVTGIYTFPDYLRGRCFADYVVDVPRTEDEDKWG